MSYTIAIDPGLWRCGAAIFQFDRLIAVGEPEVPRGGDVVVAIHEWVATNIPYSVAVPEAGWPAVDNTVRSDRNNVRWVSEIPQYYTADTAKRATLEALTRVVKALAPRVATYRPTTWKGQVPKDIHQKRIRALLTPAELLLVNALPRDRDALDAVGVGLFVLCRSERGGVAPR